MKIYKLLPHTADVRLYVEADTMPELFQAAVEGMAQILSRLGGIKSETKNQKLKIKNKDRKTEIAKSINLTSPDTTSLLIDFLSEALTYSQEEKAVFRKADIKKLTDTSIEAEIFGERVDEFDEDIKAVTYHEAEIKKNEKGNWEVVIVFDI